MAEDAIPRRGFLKGAGAAGAAATTVLGGRSEPAQAQTSVASAAAETTASEAYLTLTAIEARFFQRPTIPLSRPTSCRRPAPIAVL
jgi:anaerobic selenocysteine-containing dehydrogenase